MVEVNVSPKKYKEVTKELKLKMDRRTVGFSQDKKHTNTKHGEIQMENKKKGQRNFF